MLSHIHVNAIDMNMSIYFRKNAENWVRDIMAAICVE